MLEERSMSVRSANPAGKPGAPAQTTIDFKNEFIGSSAVIQANHDEKMSMLLSRLDQLQAKVSTQGDSSTGSSAPVRAVFKTKPLQAAGTSDLHERVSALESVHEEALNSLGEKLGEVEKHLMDKSDAEGLMHQIASKFTLLESRLSSQTSLNDRVAKLESRLSSHSELHSRVNNLESKHSRLESKLEPDPEHDRLITRINAKLDMIESTQRMKLQSAAPSKPLSSSADSEIRELQDRVNRLTALKARYAKEERELMQ